MTDPANLETRYPPHRARSFAETPDARTATALLAELAAAPCAYSQVSADRPLALYGGGSLGRLAQEFLKAVGREFHLVIDRKAAQLAQEPYWAGVKVVHPDEMTAMDKHGLRLAISIVNSPYVPTERSLLALGFDDVVPFYDLAENFRALHPLSNGWFAAPLTATETTTTIEVLARWDDDASRAHHLQFLAWRRLREEWSFAGAPVTTGNRFFIPEVTSILRDDECLLDAGAHHGSVIDAFLVQTKGAFRQIEAIEPDSTNRAVLDERLRSRLRDDPRITVHACALGAEEGEALFHNGLGYASQLSPTGNTTVPMRTLDALELSPTFLKLHLEGGELATLKGARETLLAHRPIVAATVYHNADGIWRTASWLMQMLPDYRFLFRNHSWCGTGAVIYAIPDERFCSR